MKLHSVIGSQKRTNIDICISLTTTITIRLMQTTTTPPCRGVAPPYAALVDDIEHLDGPGDIIIRNIVEK